MIEEVLDFEIPSFGEKRLVRFNLSATAYDYQYTYAKKQKLLGSELTNIGEPKIFKMYYDITIECVEDIDPLTLGTIIKQSVLDLKSKCKDVIIKG